MSVEPTGARADLPSGGDGAADGHSAAAISRAIVGVLRARTGREATNAKTALSVDLAIVTLGDHLTAAERTLVREGSALAKQFRTALHEGMRAEAVAAVEAITGRQVAAYLTAHQHDPEGAIIALHFSPRPYPTGSDGPSGLMSASDAARDPRPGALTLTVEASDSAVLLRMAGDLDLANIGQVMAALDRVDLDRTTQLVFDLQEVVFLDSAGLQTILRLNDHCKDQGSRVKVVKPHGLASRVFTLTRVHLELDLVDPAHGLGAQKGLTRDEGVRTTSPGSKYPSQRRRPATPQPSR